jgi:5-methylthioadenosine/S-adenosylhomocysteine deaminase
MDTLVRDTTLFTLRDGKLGIVEDGAIGVSGDEIAYVGPTDELEESAETVIDGSGTVTMPGLVNAHAHTRHTLLRGGAQDVPEIGRCAGRARDRVDEPGARPAGQPRDPR